jgi:serine/threonine-protein kinase
VVEARELGQYRLGDRIGGGGMGEVYRATHRLLKRDCAIKIIRPDRAGEPSALARFEREAQSAAQLDSPHTIDIYDYGRTEDGTFYCVMEYLHGLSLHELVKRHGPLPAGRVVYLMRQACLALSEAHEAGVIHRDLKPANLYSTRRGGRFDVTKVLDFGLVKQLAPAPDQPGLSRDGWVTGTPAYMSPEQATGLLTLDGRSDLFSLGSVMYFLLTGVAPFPGDRPSRVMVAVAREPVAFPTSLQGVVPADLESIVLRCLRKDRDARYGSARILQEALAACQCTGEWNEERAESWWREEEPWLTKVRTIAMS